VIYLYVLNLGHRYMGAKTGMGTEKKHVSGALVSLQFILGGMAFFCLFAALFNGLDRLAIVATFAGLALNMLISAFIARRDIGGGVTAAMTFGGPALLFSFFSLGDALIEGNARPFLFWLSCGVIAISFGLLGVKLVALRTGPGTPG